MKYEFTIGHLFAGSGGGAYGAAEARVRIGSHEACFRTLGGVDIDKLACDDFEYLVDAPCEQADIHEMQTKALRRLWGREPPDMVLLSPPCKGFSALLNKRLAKQEKYQRLNKLVLDGLFLICSAWDQPPAIVFMENVPRITYRGKSLLDKARQLLRSHGYLVTEDDYHDCGELGGLAQHRKRFFMVARDPARVPGFIYQPGKNRVKACGEVLAPLPTPGDVADGGAMHALPKISWLNWVRLALIPAGGDWRDLPGVIPEGKTRREVHRRHMIADWEKPVATVAGSGSNGVNNIADPRVAAVVALKKTADGAKSFKGRPGLFGVNDWGEPLPTVTASASISGSNAVAAVADPRVALGDNPGRHHNKYNVLAWENPAKTVISATRPGSGAPAVADPRIAPREDTGWHSNVLGVKAWHEPLGVVTGSAAPSRGAFAVADPRLTCKAYKGAYGVLSWEQAAATVTGSMCIDNGRAAIADPRLPCGVQLLDLGELATLIPNNPRRPPPFIPVIIAADGTWHRPLTTLELAALQGFPTMHKGAPLEFAGTSTTAWRERVGNAIPPPAAKAIASEMLLALLGALLDRRLIAKTDIWVDGLEDEPIYANEFLIARATVTYEISERAAIVETPEERKRAITKDTHP